MSHASSYPTASSADAGASAQREAETPLLELAHVTRRFGGLPAVEDLSFRVRQGEVLGMIGPNGAGKSTVISLIGGALAPSEGTVRFQGQDITRLSPHKRARLGIARTFQVTQPFAQLDIRDNVVVGALFSGHARNRKEAAEQADAVLTRVGLAGKAHLKGDELTVADRKRLEMARALAMRPHLLLLDEVMAGLTPREVGEAVQIIREINQSGVTVLVVEHVMRAITGVSDRILVLHHGRKIAEDTPDTVLSDPRVVEAYLGERYARERAAQQTRLAQQVGGVPSSVEQTPAPDQPDEPGKESQR
ncbi:MAG TPA: ABC transporter ATP-binding protein [Ktedonobacterales bacterium]|nr:ABC transporter ATP-binding protein [Ktedonobacterales bacterium]